ncbi:MAG: hypothetical protein SGCHY_004760 [Lobulomycetales sp.]
MTRKLKADPATVQERRAKVAKRLGLSSKAELDTLVPEAVNVWVFDDFLQHKHPTKKLMAVVKSARFVQAFRKECAFLSPRPTTLALFLDWNDLDCTEKHSFSRFLNARLERNAGFRQKRRLVFANLWPAILRKVPQNSDARTFALVFRDDGVPLVQALHFRKPCSLRGLVDQRISEMDFPLFEKICLSNGGQGVADNFRYYKYLHRVEKSHAFAAKNAGKSSSAVYDKDVIDRLATAIILHERTINDKEEREMSLKNALKANSVSYRADSRFCRDYVDGSVYFLFFLLLPRFLWKTSVKLSLCS